MGIEARFVPGPTSPAHDFFQLMFETTDVFSNVWQPYLKGCGRLQLEMANLVAKQAQAALEFGHLVARSNNPASFFDAYMGYWRQAGDNAVQASRNITGAFVRAAQPPAGIELFQPPAPKVRRHDVLRLEDWPAELYQRKVA